MKPRLLDLFCGAGGCTKGYQQAGFYVVGVDIKEQPRYVGDEFIQADVMEWFPMAIDSGYVDGFDVIHASPPCQAYSVLKHLSNGTHPELVEEIRELLTMAEKPYVIENVPGSPLLNPLMLCGSMFGLPLIRHRLFECKPDIWFPPATCQCKDLYTHSGNGISSFENGATAISVAGHNFIMADGQLAMGINWTTRDELSQAIPPAYTEFIGRKMLETIQ